MGRPQEHDKRVSTAVRLNPDTHARLKAEAATRDVSANYLTERAVVEFLDRLIPVDELLVTRDRKDEPDMKDEG